MSLKGIYSSRPSPGGLPFPIAFPPESTNGLSLGLASVGSSETLQPGVLPESSSKAGGGGGGAGCRLTWVLPSLQLLASVPLRGPGVVLVPSLLGWDGDHLTEWELAASDTGLVKRFFISHLLARAVSITHMLVFHHSCPCPLAGIWLIVDIL